MVSSDKHSLKRKIIPYIKNPQVLGVILIALVIPFTYYMVGQRTQTQQDASTVSVPFDPVVEPFEDIGLTGWQKVTETGTSVSVTSTAAYAGSFGYYVNANGGDDARITRTIPQTPQLYTRFRVKLAHDTTPRFGQSIFSIGQGGYNNGVTLHTRSDNGYINRLQGYDPGGQLFDTGIDLKATQWYTFEVYLEPGLQGKLTVWLDGAPAPILERTGNWPSTPIDFISLGSDGGSNGNEYYFDDFAMSNATKVGTGDPQFGVGPKRINGAPAGNLAETTTQTTLSLQTSTAATCKYSTTNNTDFDQFPNTFSSTGGTTHSHQITGLSKGNSYKYYVRCKDAGGVKNLDDYLIYFTIPYGSLAIDTNTSVTLIPNYEAMSVYAKFTGDADKNASAQIFYRASGSSTWKKGMRMTPERRESLPAEFRNQFRGVIFGLLPNTNYDVEVRFTDPGGVNGGATTFATSKSIATRDDNPPLGTVVATPNTTNLTISTSGTPDKWISYTPPTGQQAAITGTVTINANYIRLKGFNFSGAGNIRIDPNASNVIIENNTFVTTQNVIREGGAYSGTSATSENITIQNNTFTIPAGTTQAAKFIDFVNNTKGGHVIRRNTFKDLSGAPRVSGQYWDCIGGAPNFSIYGFVHRDSDINDNNFEGCNDDQLESDGGNMNVRIWNNTFNGGLNALQAMSVDPTLLGPLYVVRNVSYGEHLSGFAKLGSDSIGNIYFYHNSHYSTPTGEGFKYANPVQQNITSRNNIMQANRYVLELTDGGATNTFDYDNLFTTDSTRFAKWDGNSTYNTLTKFQTIIQQVNGFGDNISAQNIGQEKNGYNFDMVTDRVNGFVSPASNDLRLLSTSTLIDKGQVIDGINNADSPWPYQGNGPDIGMYESGTTGTPLATPTPTTVQAVTATPTAQPPIGGTNPTTTLALSPATASKTTGTTTTTNVTINTQNSVTNADLVLSFNPSVIEVTNVALGTFLTGAQEVTKNIDNTSGKVLYSFYIDSANAKSGTGTIATITWRAKSAGTSTLSFDPSTTIVYGTGTGNTIASGGLSSATYTVTGTSVPTATPTAAVNTPVPPTATNTIAPTVVGDPACTIGSASWNFSSVDEGTLVTLKATVSGLACLGKQVTFKVRENDSILEGGLDEDAATQPAAAVVSGSTATTTWIAEWQNDCNGLCNSPEYYFNATVGGPGGNTVRSAGPLLSVQKTETAVTIKLTLPNLSASQDMLNSTVTIRNTQTNTDVSKTVTLVPGANNVYTGTLQTVLIPGNYAMVVKRHQFLAKRFTFTVGSTAPNLDFSSTPLVGGDINNDNVINTLDLGKVIEEYSPQADTTAVSDLTRDKRINALDLGVVIENYFKQGEIL